jgi:hypothetical protein
LIFYLPITFYYELQPYSTNETLFICNFIDLNSQLILGYMDLMNRVLIPLLLMLIFSSLLIQHIFKSRLRISNNNISYSNKQNKTFKRDTKFSVTSIILSIIYAILTLPNSIDVFFNNYYFYITYPAFLFLFYSSYAVNFYIIILTNSFVRNEFFIFFKSKKSLPTNGVNGTIRI